MLVCVPKILDVLREHVVRAFPETATSRRRPGISIPGRWWRYRRVHRAFGLKFWAFVVGAAPLPPDLEEFWRRLGFAVIQGYGLTETAPIVTLNHPFKTSKGSVGTPIAGVEIQHRRRRRDPRARRERHDAGTTDQDRADERARSADVARSTPRAGSTPATSARRDAHGRLFIRAARRK